MLDESTDFSGNEKLMAYCIRYYNARLERVVVDFLGFQSYNRYIIRKFSPIYSTEWIGFK